MKYEELSDLFPSGVFCDLGDTKVKEHTKMRVKIVFESSGIVEADEGQTLEDAERDAKLALAAGDAEMGTASRLISIEEVINEV